MAETPGPGTAGRVKDELRGWLTEGRVDRVAEAAATRRRILSTLTSLTYDPDPLVSWRAVAALGEAAARVAESDAEFVREHLRRLLWLVTDESGGIAWRAPEAIGEIIRGRPVDFADFVPLLLSLLDLEPEDRERFLPGTLWAIGRVGQVAPDLVAPSHAAVLDTLTAAGAESRGAAAWCALQLGLRPSRERLEDLLADDRAVALFIDGRLVPTTIRRIAQEWDRAPHA